jgi:hypothetical protein
MAGSFPYEKQLTWIGVILGIISTILLIRVSLKQHSLAKKQEDLAEYHLKKFGLPVED